MESTTRKTGKLLTLRWITRCCALLAALVLGLSLLPWSWAPRVLPAASPYIMVCSAIARRSLGAVALFGMPVLVIALVRRRWFCHYACPMGSAGALLGLLRRRAGRRWTKPPHLGQWVVLLTVGGACLGYPLLLWMDPLALFSGFLNIFRLPVSASGVAAGMGMPIVLLISLLWPNLWHEGLCPLGAMQDWLASLRRIVSPAGSLSEQPSGFSSSPTRLARRSALAAGLGVAWAAAVKTSRGRGPRLIRPPGSTEERRFTGLCVRCGNCVRACPTGIIRPDLDRHSLAGFLAPVVRFDSDYCREDCCRCTEVCPSGAIASLSLEEKRNTPIGLARVYVSRCLLFQDQECSACVQSCPYEAIRVVFDEKDYRSAPRVDAERCPGCGACEAACPTIPKAILVDPTRA